MTLENAILYNRHKYSRCEKLYDQVLTHVAVDRGVIYNYNFKPFMPLAHVRHILYGERRIKLFVEYFDPASDIKKQEKLKLKFV